MILAVVVWLSIIGIAFLAFGLAVKFGLSNEIKEFKESKIVTVKENKKQDSLTKFIDKEFILKMLYLQDRDEPFSYETLKDNDYVPRTFLAGRGSWRASQGNVFTLSMLTKEIADEFDKRL